MVPLLEISTPCKVQAEWPSHGCDSFDLGPNCWCFSLSIRYVCIGLGHWLKNFINTSKLILQWLLIFHGTWDKTLFESLTQEVITCKGCISHWATLIAACIFQCCWHLYPPYYFLISLQIPSAFLFTNMSLNNFTFVVTLKYLMLHQCIEH